MTYRLALSAPLTVLAAAALTVAALAPAHTAPVKRGFTAEQVQRWGSEIIAEQLTEHGCATVPALTDRVAVVSATGFDRGVVRVVPFDRAWADAKAGRVFAVGWGCR